MNRGLVVVMVVVFLAPLRPAEARCIRGEVAVHRYGQPDLVLVTEAQCLLSTPFPEDVVVVDEDANESSPPMPPPTGTPTGVRLKVYVPF